MATWSTRAFEALLSLYPRGFRDEYGREISLLFADRYRHAATTGERALVWLDSLAGLAREAPKEHCRMILQDLRYAIRALRVHPLFASTIVLTLALGIGANTAIFSLINAVALRTLPLADPGELYAVKLESREPVPQRFSWPKFERLRAAVPSGAIAAMTRVARIHSRPDGAREFEAASVQLVSGEYFGVLKAPIAIGRPLAPGDNLTPGAHPVAVISHGYWLRRFGGSAGVLGKNVTLDRTRFTIVGVAASGFAGVWLESPVDAWIPLAMQRDVHYSQNYSASESDPAKPWMLQDQISWLEIVVRTPNATSMTAALDRFFRAAMLAYAESIRDPEERQRLLDIHLSLAPFGTGFSRLRERFLKPLYLLMAMAALVLLIACANAANLLLARAAGRQREIALRLSLGAGRLRLVQQLLTESSVLVLLAGIAALFASHWASSLLVRMATASTEGPAPFHLETDLRVLAFGMSVALVTTLLFGLAPALRSTRVDLTGTLKAGSRSVLGGGRGTGQARMLVVLQVALSLVLVSGTGLLIRSFQNLANLDLGFDSERILTVEMRIETEQQQRRLLERVRVLPGVRSASVAMCGVARGCRSYSDGYAVEGYQTAKLERIGFLVNLVEPDYFGTMGMRLVEGRTFDQRDREKSPPVAVINEAAARKYFRGDRAVGRRIGHDAKLDTEIAGVVRDARVLSPRDEPMPMVFYALTQRPGQASVLEIRAAADPRLAIAAVRRVLAEEMPDVPVRSISVLADQVSANLSQDRLILSLSSAFGALALGLAGFGLFGILSFAVVRRTPEFGIRIALGASSGRVLWSVCREALAMVLAGVAVGFPVVLFCSRAMSTLLFGVSPQDWSAFASAGAALIVVASVAGLLPAWRASRVDPVIALRME